MTPGQYVALAYAVVLVVVLAYVAIIAAKLVRLQRETEELLELVRRRDLRPDEADRPPLYAARVPETSAAERETESA